MAKGLKELRMMYDKAVYDASESGEPDLPPFDEWAKMQIHEEDDEKVNKSLNDIYAKKPKKKMMDDWQ